MARSSPTSPVNDYGLDRRGGWGERKALALIPTSSSIRPDPSIEVNQPDLPYFYTPYGGSCPKFYRHRAADAENGWAENTESRS
ncbi:hypothetical protein N7495_007482 [Penicillium taxi]|uniref:uncharacterized protein n=1 Tax=Penicillium taxi TaxID=168475 RepID=UPI00254591BB|nr:uncharacterized protein N7495_007482 [Penicillium taxi]KAJ5887441.1 hypothetical protein N7495_007482 [Penicillium taxi]